MYLGKLNQNDNTETQSSKMTRFYWEKIQWEARQQYNDIIYKERKIRL